LVDIVAEQEPAPETTPAEEAAEETGASVPWWTYVVIVAVIVALGLGGVWLYNRRRAASQVKSQ